MQSTETEKGWNGQMPKITEREFDAIVDGSADTIEQQDKPRRKNKQKFIKVFVNPETKELLKTKASECSMPLSGYLKATGLAQEIKPPIPLNIRRNIAGWSRLFNQACAIGHATGELPLQMVKDLQAQATEIIKLIRKGNR